MSRELQDRAAHVDVDGPTYVAPAHSTQLLHPGAAPAEPPPGLVGSLAGSYRLVKLLGEGGMGQVYLGQHPAIGSRVAVKVLHPALARDPAVVARFYDEARAANLIGHENIVSIHDLVVVEGRYCLVMELLEGQTLASFVGGAPVPPQVALPILLQLCDALQCAHDRGVVHRDLKPDNVFLLERRGRDHFVKVVDFGIAKLRGAAPGGPRETGVGTVIGTPEYMAPEQCEGLAVDGRTDLYALGAIAYAMSTGRPPFEGTSVPQLLVAHLEKPPPDPRELVPELPAAWARAILVALAKRPEARFPSMAAFGEALAQALWDPAPAPRVGSSPRDSSPRACSVRLPAVADPRSGAASPAPPLVEVEVEAAGFPRRRATCVAVSRGGAFVALAGALPRVGTRLQLALPAGGAVPVRIDAEIVRHVGADEARAWGLSPGVGVQLLPRDAEVRAAAEAILAGRAPATRAPAPADVAAAEKHLDQHRLRAGSPYRVLAAPLDVEPAEAAALARKLAVPLDALLEKLLPEDLAEKLATLRRRIEDAADALATPSRRVGIDVELGNFRGVSRCLAAGLPLAELERLHRTYLATRPWAVKAVRRSIHRAATLEANRAFAEALAAYEEALTADPLDFALHQRYLALRRELASRAPKP